MMVFHGFSCGDFVVQWRHLNYCVFQPCLAYGLWNRDSCPHLMWLWHPGIGFAAANTKQMPQNPGFWASTAGSGLNTNKQNKLAGTEMWGQVMILCRDHEESVLPASKLRNTASRRPQLESDGCAIIILKCRLLGLVGDKLNYVPLNPYIEIWI